MKRQTFPPDCPAFEVVVDDCIFNCSRRGDIVVGAGKSSFDRKSLICHTSDGSMWRRLFRASELRPLTETARTMWEWLRHE